MGCLEADSGAFDFDRHKAEAQDAYEPLFSLYRRFADTVRTVLQSAMSAAEISVHSVEARGKTVESFANKATEPSDEDPSVPKYSEPLAAITDLAGVRIIAFFLSTVEQLDALIHDEFEVIEKLVKGELLDEKEMKIGYQSVHYIVQLTSNRTALSEYAQYSDLVCEIQVRTILQHAWAEIEHDIQYKSVASLPQLVRRRFVSLAGLLEIADREFEAIGQEHERIQQDARTSIEEGRLDQVEITPDALKTYLDKKFGLDFRMSSFTYRWTAGLLQQLGFTSLEEVDACIAGYNDDAISRVLHGWRQGQITRFEDTLLAALGEEFIERHPWGVNPEMSWFPSLGRAKLDKIVAAGIEIRRNRPSA
jgi:ppGpp synthetase/RelA/SpoT-type nucleotidyltranferase